MINTKIKKKHYDWLMTASHLRKKHKFIVLSNIFQIGSQVAEH